MHCSLRRNSGKKMAAPVVLVYPGLYFKTTTLIRDESHQTEIRVNSIIQLIKRLNLFSCSEIAGREPEKCHRAINAFGGQPAVVGVRWV